MTKRVLVAMSGGVDSSTAAALLLQQGYAVEGVTMKLTPGLCCDLASAQAVCSVLGIRHHAVDMHAEFERRVVDNFVAEYRMGRTPNPCIRCNDLIKFNALLDHARAGGFDLLATGHYARAERDPVTSRWLLKKGLDPDKDQSYFLYRLTQQQLERVLFPIGAMKKREVRGFASSMKLPAADRPESQEVCFVPDDDYRAFLKERAPDTLQPGDMVLTDGTVVGSHDGVAFFTIGQRRKLGVSAGERLYVVRIEPDRNRVVLGRQGELETREMVVSSPVFVAIPDIEEPLSVTVKIRYRSPFAPAMISKESIDRVRVVFGRPVTGVSPGQAAVFYREDVVIGGGIIER